MNETAADFASLREWIGRSESRSDVVTATPVAALAATLDHPPAEHGTGRVLPPLWHWLFFLPIVARSQIGVDGHPARGGFLPPVALPRRMWAGSRLKFLQPLRIGDRVQRDSTIIDVEHKRGRSGDLVFVIVRHDVRNASGLAISEEQQIVYREAATAGAATAAPVQTSSRKADWERPVHPDPVLLFRYSALTFNGHRIHYDRPYATGEEGYPGLVVHGPLMATLLLDALAAADPAARIVEFEFRAQRPLFDIADFKLAGARERGDWSLWAASMDGAIAVEARATTARD